MGGSEGEEEAPLPTVHSAYGAGDQLGLLITHIIQHRSRNGVTSHMPPGHPDWHSKGKGTGYTSLGGWLPDGVPSQWGKGPSPVHDRGTWCLSVEGLPWDPSGCSLRPFLV